MDEAAHLLLRLKSPGADGLVTKEAAEWRARSSEHARAWDLAERFWSAMGEIGPEHEVFRTPPTFVRRIQPRSWSKTRRMSAAIGMAAAACLALVVAPSLSLALRSDYRTGTGETRSITLADGSSVALDTGSAIKINGDDQGRGVTLLAGRAWFEVAKDRSRPFRVAAGDVTVTVTGTQFDVGMTDRGVDVRLAEGGVRADYPGASGTLSRNLVSGEALHFERSKDNASVARVPVDSIAAWRRGKLLIEGAPLGEIVDQLRPYYSGKIVVTSDRMRGQKVTGAFDVRDPAEALRSMVAPHGGVVRQITPWLLVVSAS